MPVASNHQQMHRRKVGEKKFRFLSAACLPSAILYRLYTKQRPKTWPSKCQQ
ncbi:Uncharacterized protein APZ42_028441 [Daphnia magna]|uniref:Uncharacterized protein n=1 Tax=Daphnia magna TaxID=35525 RepID=A0A164QI16_9CRUS|nr:Uncharacterized protein APZ42_028441 [Daphnia magna]